MPKKRETNKALVEMFQYNAWANDELYRACRSLTDAQLDTQLKGISGTVRELLLHIAGGQQTMILRTKGRQHEGELDRESQWPGFDRLISIVEETNWELIAIAEQIDGDAEIDLAYQDKAYRYPIRFFLVHALEHSVEHRTEVKVALGQMGVETPDLDGWSYSAAAGYGQVSKAG